MTCRTWNHGGKSTTERGYGWRWQQLRKRILARDKHLCQSCKRKGRITAGNEVDHKLAKSKGGTDDESNLECICTPCHIAKSAADRGAKLKRAVDIDGWPIE